MSSASSRDVLGFMFRSTMEECLNLWFGKASATDEEVKRKFGRDVELALMGPMVPLTLNGELAMLILLDQFTRHIYRGTAKAYAGDILAQRIARGMVLDKKYRFMTGMEAIFLCLVLTHSERLEDQDLCISVWFEIMKTNKEVRAIKKPGLCFSFEYGLSEEMDAVMMRTFENHRFVIHKFRRFPHRNEILGRESFPEEIEFLKDSTYRFDQPRVPNTAGIEFSKGA